MLSAEQILTLVAATLVLVAIPGPNLALIVARTLSHGRTFGLAAVAGTTVGVSLQLAFLVAGLLTVATQIASALFWLKWLGVLYLLYVGIKTFFTPAEDLAAEAPRKSELIKTASEGLGVALLNPKTLLFNAAFLMQFVDPSQALGAQLGFLGAVFLATLAIGDAVWVLLAGYARPYLLKVGRLRNRIAGGFLALTAVALATTKRA